MNDDLVEFFNEVVFVAIKNGMHDKGLCFLHLYRLRNTKRKVHVSKIHNIILIILKFKIIIISMHINNEM